MATFASASRPARATSPARPAPRPRLLALAAQAALLSLPGTAAWAQAPSARTLPQVTVETTREQPVAGTATTISAEELERQGAAELADVVRYQPLVSAPGIASGSGNLWDGAGTQGINIRGLDGNRVAIEVDGIELPGAENKPDNTQNNSFSTGRDTIDPELYREVQIESGASPSGRSGSQGIGGRVSFATKSPQDFLGQGRTTHAGYKLGYLSRDRSWAHALTGAAQIGSVQALGIYSRRDGKADKNKGDVDANPRDWHSDALLAKFVWGASTENRLGLSVEHFDRDSRHTQNNKITATIPQAPGQDANDRRTRVSLEHRYAPVAGTVALFDTLSSRLYYQTAESKARTQVPLVLTARPYSRQIRTNSSNDTWGFNSDASKQIGSHNLYYGLSLDRTESERPWEETRTSTSGANLPQPLRDRAAEARVTRLSLYVRDEIGFELAGRRATFTPGLTVRHQRFKPTDSSRYANGSAASAAELASQSDTVVTPSLNLSVALVPGFDAYAQYSRGARLPSVSELTGSFENPTTGYAVLGNPDLKKETSDNFELGVRGQPAQGVTLSASAFYSRFKNYIEYEDLGFDPNLPQFFGCTPASPFPAPCVYRPTNLGKATIWGAELATRLELGTWAPAARGYSVDLGAGWQQGSARNRSTGNKGWLPSSLPAKVVLGLAYDDPSQRFGAAVHATYVRGKQARGDVLSVNETAYLDVPSATVFDATAYWQINRHASLNFGIYNLTDRKYWDYASVYSLSAANRTDSERQTEPGRNVGATLRVQF